MTISATGFTPPPPPTAAFLGLGAFATTNAKAEADIDQGNQGIAFDLDRIADRGLRIDHAFDFANGFIEQTVDVNHLDLLHPK
jgi:hypothetical protein